MRRARVAHPLLDHHRLQLPSHRGEGGMHDPKNEENEVSEEGDLGRRFSKGNGEGGRRLGQGKMREGGWRGGLGFREREIRLGGHPLCSIIQSG